MMTKPYMPKSKSCEWGTPQWLFDELDRRYGLNVDAAASDELHMLPHYWTKADDGLKQPWAGLSVFANPPFDAQSLAAWTEKAVLETVSTACLVAMVVPVKSDQEWWHVSAMQASAIHFVHGRVHFSGAQSSYPGPIAVLVFGMGGDRPHLLSLRTPANRECEQCI